MQVSCEEIANSFYRARQAFRDVRYPASRLDLINKANESNIRKSVLQVIESLPERVYYSYSDAINVLDNIQNALQPFLCLEYPVTKIQLIEACRSHNALKVVIVALENCPDIVYNNVDDVISSCGGYFIGEAVKISVLEEF